MRIYRPVRSDRITQRFHDDKACVDVDPQGLLIFPPRVSARRGDSCGDGRASFYGSMGMKGHGGHDFAAWAGEPVYHSVVADTLWRVEYDSDPTGGIGIDVCSTGRIAVPLPDHPQAQSEWHAHGGKLFAKFRYWHAVENVAAEKMIFPLPGEFIQRAGMTGGATGVHVHMGMKYCMDDGRTLDSDNGYFGNVDMEPFFVNEFILNIIKGREAPLTFADRFNKFLFTLHI